jgi:DNA polymerase III delta subunit
MVYLFIGQDGPAKEAKIETLKRGLFPMKDMGNFNFDTLYADGLDLDTLQETLLRLPIGAKNRLVWLRRSQKLKERLKEYLRAYVRKPFAHTTLIVDMEHFDRKDVFQASLISSAKVLRFDEKEALDPFDLCDEIDRRDVKSGLKILHELIDNGTRPETILGALRYAWEKGYLPVDEKKRRFKFLLSCDISIKTGKIKPLFALERLIVGLCAGA